MDCTLLGGGNTLSYEHGFIKQEGVVIGAVKNVLYTEAVESNIRLMNALYDQPRPITDGSLGIMHELTRVTDSMIHWL